MNQGGKQKEIMNQWTRRSEWVRRNNWWSQGATESVWETLGERERRWVYRRGRQAGREGDRADERVLETDADILFGWLIGPTSVNQATCRSRSLSKNNNNNNNTKHAHFRPTARRMNRAPFSVIHSLLWRESSFRGSQTKKIILRKLKVLLLPNRV